MKARPPTPTEGIPIKMVAEAIVNASNTKTPVASSALRDLPRYECARIIRATRRTHGPRDHPFKNPTAVAETVAAMAMKNRAR
jgi:hypothetical protein